MRMPVQKLVRKLTVMIELSQATKIINQVKTVVYLIHVLSISLGLEMVLYICLRFPPHPLLQDMAPSYGT